MPCPKWLGQHKEYQRCNKIYGQIPVCCCCFAPNVGFTWEGILLPTLTNTFCINQTFDAKRSSLSSFLSLGCANQLQCKMSWKASNFGTIRLVDCMQILFFNHRVALFAKSAKGALAFPLQSHETSAYKYVILIPDPMEQLEGHGTVVLLNVFSIMLPSTMFWPYMII